MPPRKHRILFSTYKNIQRSFLTYFANITSDLCQNCHVSLVIFSYLCQELRPRLWRHSTSQPVLFKIARIHTCLFHALLLCALHIRVAQNSLHFATLIFKFASSIFISRSLLNVSSFRVGTPHVRCNLRCLCLRALIPVIFVSHTHTQTQAHSLLTPCGLA